MFQPPPPPHPNMMNGVDPAAAAAAGGVYNNRGGLNVADPRFAAKYGNPYLAPAPSAGGMDPASMGGMMGGNPSPQVAQRYPYATLNNRGYTNGNQR